MHSLLAMSVWLLQEWQQVALHNTPSRSHPSGGHWKTAVIPIPAGSEPVGLEFIIKSSCGQVHFCAEPLHPCVSCLVVIPSLHQTRFSISYYMKCKSNSMAYLSCKLVEEAACHWQALM